MLILNNYRNHLIDTVERKERGRNQKNHCDSQAQFWVDTCEGL